MAAAGLTIWVVYDHPTDHPNHYVARKFNMDIPTQDLIADKSLTIIRDWLQGQGLTFLPRQEDDDPNIIEIWF